MRDQVREGQRIEGYTVELFIARPYFRNPRKWTEGSIAKIRYVKSRDQWWLYWMRGDLNGHAYPEMPTPQSIQEALQEIHEDPLCCFWG